MRDKLYTVRLAFMETQEQAARLAGVAKRTGVLPSKILRRGLKLGLRALEIELAKRKAEGLDFDGDEREV
jgi:hypothetical protein